LDKVQIQVGKDDINDQTRGLIWLDNSAQQKPLLEELLRKHDSIAWIQLPMAGVTAYADVIKKYKNKVWTSAKGAYAQPCAEHALMLALGVLRSLPMRTHAIEWGPQRAISLYGSNIVILGAGGIAVELLSLLAPYKVSVSVLRRKAEPLKDEEVPESLRKTIKYGTLSSLDEHLPKADVVFVTCALTPETNGCLGAKQFSLMHDRSVVVNVARGECIQTDALVEALQKGTIYGAGLDVTAPEPLPPKHPLWTLERTHGDTDVSDAQGGARRANVIITPHVANTTETLVPLLSERISNNVQAWQRQLPVEQWHGLVEADAGY
jgi:phosphoglycerate dehydrogenase-like enzyme